MASTKGGLELCTQSQADAVHRHVALRPVGVCQSPELAAVRLLQTHGSAQLAEGKMERIDAEEDTTIYNVVVNHEEQYSIWPADRESPAGWTVVGKSGLKVECLEYIKAVWTDMRPLSLRKIMQEHSRAR